MAEASPKRSTANIVLVAALVVLGTGAGWFFRGSSATQPAASTDSKINSVLHLESFVLNLADPDEKAFLRVGVDLGLEGGGQGHESGEAPIALLRDTVLGVLTQYRPDELLTSEGKAKLKTNLLHALQQRAPGLGVQEVYFTEFLVQR